jgi:hypothetical protein
VPDLTPKNAVYSLELDLERAREISERGLILRTTVGSVVHGLSNPGTDDRDELGVCVEPPEYLLGFHRFEHFVYRTQPEGMPSGPGDLDLTVYGLRKYCRLGLKGSPTTLLPLFVDGEDVIARTPAGEALQALAPAFVARSTGRAFLGYLDAQRQGLLGERHATRTRELSGDHGYDTKYAMHALRIGYQGIELLETGRITLPVGEPERCARSGRARCRWTRCSPTWREWTLRWSRPATPPVSRTSRTSAPSTGSSWRRIEPRGTRLAG